jgi:hypothetical protein
VRLDAVLLPDHGVGDLLVPADAAGGVEHADPGLVVDELEEVAVAGDDLDRHPGIGGQRPDHVVGLVAVGARDRDAERVQDVDDDRDLRLERVGDLFDVGAAGHDVLDPVRLVARDQVDPPLRPPVVVPAAREVGGSVLLDETADEVQQAAHRVDRRAVGRGDRVGHAVVGAEVQRGGVEQQQLPRAVGHARQPSGGRRPRPGLGPDPDNRRIAAQSV